MSLRADYVMSSSRTEGWSEQSSTIVHTALRDFDAESRVVLWNTVPTHPHRDADPLSNRRVRKLEIEAGAPFTLRLLDMVQPRVVIAIGRTAEQSLMQSLQGVPYVRHPANGGASKFKEGMKRLLV